MQALLSFNSNYHTAYFIQSLYSVRVLQKFCIPKVPNYALIIAFLLLYCSQSPAAFSLGSVKTFFKSDIIHYNKKVVAQVGQEWDKRLLFCLTMLPYIQNAINNSTRGVYKKVKSWQQFITLASWSTKHLMFRKMKVQQTFPIRK